MGYSLFNSNDSSSLIPSVDCSYPHNSHEILGRNPGKGKISPHDGQKEGSQTNTGFSRVAMFLLIIFNVTVTPINHPPGSPAEISSGSSKVSVFHSIDYKMEAKKEDQKTNTQIVESVGDSSGTKNLTVEQKDELTKKEVSGVRKRSVKLKVSAHNFSLVQ